MRFDICATANDVPLSSWADTSPMRDWTYRDVLARCAINRWLLHTILTGLTVPGSREITSIPGGPVVDAATSVLHDEWRARGIEDIVRKVEAEAAETQDLIETAMTDGLIARNASRALLECVSGAVRDDRECLDALRAALGSTRGAKRAS